MAKHIHVHRTKDATASSMGQAKSLVRLIDGALNRQGAGKGNEGTSQDFIQGLRNLEEALIWFKKG